MHIPGSQSLGFLFNTVWVKQWFSQWDIWQISVKNQRENLSSIKRWSIFLPVYIFLSMNVKSLKSIIFSITLVGEESVYKNLNERKAHA